MSFDVTSSDNCDSEVDVVCEDDDMNAILPTAMPGSFQDTFGQGSHHITCRGTDDAGLSTECDFNIVVEDVTPPAFQAGCGAITSDVADDLT